MSALALVVASLLAAPNYRSAYPLPKSDSVGEFGVNIHFTHGAPGEVEKIRASGFKWIRMDFVWDATERKKEVYDFADYDVLLSDLDRVRIRPLFILDYGNNLYQDGSPRNIGARAAFCRWVEAAMKHFRHRGVVWEMWNEPNIGFWKPKPDVKEYISLATEVGQTIRRVAPDEWYIGPATSGLDFGFLNACLEAGLLKYWDAVSVHPYRQTAPETALEEWSHLRSLVAKSNPTGKNIEMISGEWGYSAAWGGFDESKQATFATRELLTNLIAGAPLSIYYDWKDDGNSVTDPECHFGTVHQDLSPKPTGVAISRLRHAIEGSQYRGYLTTKDGAVVVVLQQGSDWKAIAWSRKGNVSADLSWLGSTSNRDLGEDLSVMVAHVRRKDSPAELLGWPHEICEFSDSARQVKIEGLFGRIKHLPPTAQVMASNGASKILSWSVKDLKKPAAMKEIMATLTSESPVRVRCEIDSWGVETLVW